MNIANVRAGLTANVKSKITGVEMTGYVLNNPSPPCFEVDFPDDSYTFDVSFGRGTDELTLIVRGLVAENSDIDAQKTLDSWLDGSSGSSVKAAIESDKTLNGACDDLHVLSATGPRRIASLLDPQVRYLGAEWRVRVLGGN